jgi:hypothetical protein
VRTEDLIAELTERVTPVRPLPPPAVRTLGWFVLAAACGVVGVASFGARSDVMVRLTQSDYLWIAGLVVLTSMFAVVVSLMLSIPGAERTPVLRVSTLGLLGLWTVTMVWAVLAAGRGLPISTDPHWPVCFIRVFAVGVLPALVLFGMVRRGHPLRLGWTAAMAALAAAAVGALAVQVACPLDDPGHGFLGHFVPVMVMAAIGVGARPRLLRKTAF